MERGFMMSENISLKSTQDGLAVRIREDAPFYAVLAEISALIKRNAAFFAGSERPVVFLGRSLSLMEKKGISRVFREECGITDLRFSSVFDEKKTAKKENTLLVENIRSGRRVTSDGDLILIGNAEEGSELIAAGNIIVLGKLSGNAYAGSSGDEKACIAAQFLQPRKLRIANFVGVLPEGREALQAEAVFAEEERLVIRKAGIPVF